jgi:hypothetical protein
MVEVPYIMAVFRVDPEFHCPHCGTGLSAEWENCKPDASNNLVEACPVCQHDIKYGTRENGTWFLAP